MELARNGERGTLERIRRRSLTAACLRALSLLPFVVSG